MLLSSSFLLFVCFVLLTYFYYITLKSYVNRKCHFL
nr:MAG TPA: hypothetical protein [Caudoviricetes sp.]